MEPEDELFAQLLAELHDEEFDEALSEVVTEAAELVEDRLVAEVGDPTSRVHEAEQMLEAHFAPLALEIDGFLQMLEQEAHIRDLNTRSDAEFEGMIDQYVPSQRLTPAFENFLGSLKKAFKKVRNVAKKAANVASKFGLGVVFKKLRRLVRPLLKRVLKAAIDKLPSKYRPLAHTLAKKLGKFLKETGAETYDPAEDAFVRVAEIQREFNEAVAEILFADNESQEELVIAEYAAEAARPAMDPLGELDRARARFAREIVELEEGRDAAPTVENFIPAILPALKLGIKLAGRKRIVSFVAKLVARLIQRFVGKKFAPPLSQVIVDAGLRLINLEATPEDEKRAAGDTIAATVEDTVRQVATFPDEVLEDEAVLEGFVVEAFERAAASNMPGNVLREEVYEAQPELRETTEVGGMWLRQPLRGPKRYKKYSRIFDVAISPYAARSIRIFGGVPLASFLRDQLGLAVGRSLTARVHLYEIIPGTLPGLISAYDQSARGPSAGMMSAARMVLHPLTPEAAGLLLNEPGLGRQVSPTYLGSTRALCVGQRLYYLDIPGALLQTVPTLGAATARRSSGMHLTLDFPQDQVHAQLFLSERDAQVLAAQLRKRASIGGIIRTIAPAVGEGLQIALLQGANGALKVVHEGAVAERPVANMLKWIPPVLLEHWHAKLTRWLNSTLSQYLREQAEDFIRASEDAADGVTLVVTLAAPPGFAALRKVLQGMSIDIRGALADRGLPAGVAQAVPGYQHA